MPVHPEGVPLNNNKYKSDSSGPAFITPMNPSLNMGGMPPMNMNMTPE